MSNVFPFCLNHILAFMSNISYFQSSLLGCVVARTGFEPVTFGLWAQRANRLLYLAILNYIFFIVQKPKFLQSNALYYFFPFFLILSSNLRVNYYNLRLYILKRSSHR